MKKSTACLLATAALTITISYLSTSRRDNCKAALQNENDQLRKQPAQMDRLTGQVKRLTALKEKPEAVKASLFEMDEEKTLRLQLVKEARAQAEQTLDNLLKLLSAMENTIVANMKG